MEDIGEITERNTVALVVLYYPQPDLVMRLERVLTQVSGLLVADNTPSVDRDRQVWHWGAACESVAFLDNTGNVGLGLAYNRGFREARRRQALWVLVLDQDTDLSDGYLATATRRLKSVGYRNSAGRPIGVVGVNFVNSAVPLIHVGEIEAVADVRTVISSGSLVSVAAWSSVSGFDESLFIDYVDTDFCLKSSTAGYGVVIIGDILMRHAMGYSGRNSILGIYTRVTSNYPIFRHYYIARNFIAIAKRHGRSHLLWLIAEMTKRFRFTVLSLLMETHRRKVLQATLAGVLDGVRGRMGKKECS